MFQVSPLFFTESTDMSGEDEIKENHHTDLQSMIEEGAYLRMFLW